MLILILKNSTNCEKKAFMKSLLLFSILRPKSPNTTRKPCYRRENQAMLLKISICI